MQIKSRALVCLFFLSLGSAVFAEPNAQITATHVDALASASRPVAMGLNKPAFDASLSQVQLIEPVLKPKPVQTATVDWDGYWNCMWSVIIGGPFAALYCKLAYTY